MLVDVIITSPELVLSATRIAYQLTALYSYTVRCVTLADVIVDLRQGINKDLYILLAFDRFDLFDGQLYKMKMSKLVFIHFSGSDYSSKRPKHAVQAQRLGGLGGWTYFVQFDSYKSAVGYTTRMSWLSPCTDPDVFVPTERDPEDLPFTVFLAGNNSNRAHDLYIEMVSAGATVMVQTTGSPMEFMRVCSCAQIIVVSPDEHYYREWDTPQATLDALAMGKPVLTNASDSLAMMFDKPTYIKTYTDKSDIGSVLKEAMADPRFMSGNGARNRTMYDLNYKNRVKLLHDSLVAKGIVDDRSRV